jgi:uncharacterized protein GlcG (DUF336 family)
MYTTVRLETEFKFGRISKMKTFRLMLMFVAALSLATIALAQDLPSTKVLTFDVAQRAAQAAMAKCHADGHRTISVLVVDTQNVPIVVLRDDGSNAANLEFAKMKATTAILFRIPSDTAYRRVEPPPTLLAVLPGTLNHGGGVPIKAGDYTIGAIGLSGAGTGENDAACANAGVANIADYLK